VFACVPVLKNPHLGFLCAVFWIHEADSSMALLLLLLLLRHLLVSYSALVHSLFALARGDEHYSFPV